MAIKEKEDSKKVGQEEMKKNLEMIKQIRRARSGANSFYWIAGLSIINSAVYYFGGGMYFIAGLGITQVIEGFLSNYNTAGLILSVAFNILISGVFIGFGYFASNKRMNLAYITGMIIYFLDTLLFVIVGDIYSIVFHIYILVSIFLGYRANRKFLDMKK